MSSEDLGNWRNEILDLLDSDVITAQPDTASPAEGGTDRIEVLAFSLGDEIFGVDIRRVELNDVGQQVRQLLHAPHVGVDRQHVVVVSG